MKKKVLLSALGASVILATLNNVVNHHAVEWMGSPEVLPKPTGWPETTLVQGIAAGMKVAMKGFNTHWVGILGGLVAVIVLMIILNRKWFVSFSPMLRSVLRVGFAVLFLTAAYPKFMDPKGFSTLVAQYQFLPSFLVNPFSLWLAAFEIVVGLGIILTAWEKEFSALVGLLLIMFIIALGQALGSDLGIACGCFDIEGAADVGETWFSLLRDIVLIVPMLWLTWTGGKRFLWHFENSRN